MTTKLTAQPDPPTPEPDVQPTPEIPAAPVHSTPEIPEVLPGAIVSQENDPVFIELQKEKKRTRRLRRLLTANKNRSTVSTDGTTSPVGEPGPDSVGVPAPVLETGGGEKKKSGGPISGVLNFLGKGNKKRDGP